MITADQIIEDILNREKENKSPGYLSKNDLGGRTNWGISERAHPEEWANGKVPDKERARAIYLEIYVKPFASIRNDSIRAQLVDWCVLHGEGRTRKWVEYCIRGHKTISSQPMSNYDINGVADMPYFNDALVAWRLKLIDEISDANVKQKSNEEGWENRALSFLGA